MKEHLYEVQYVQCIVVLVIKVLNILIILVVILTIECLIVIHAGYDGSDILHTLFYNYRFFQSPFELSKIQPFFIFTSFFIDFIDLIMNQSQ